MAISNSAQLAASNPQDSVWVSANAGTGKTRVLTHRVLRLLLSGVAPSRILCLTFTNAAAAEMESRVQDELQKWAIMEAGDLKGELQAILGRAPSEEELGYARAGYRKVVDAIPSLRVHTLHAFCAGLLKRFPLEAKIAPHFTVADDISQRAMLHEAFLRLLTSRHEDARLNAAIEAIVVQINESQFDDLLMQILHEREALRAVFGDIEGYLAKIRVLWDIDENEDAEALKQAHMQKVDKAMTNAIASVMEQGSDTDIRKAGYLQSRNYEQYKRMFVTQKHTPTQTLLAQKFAKKHPDYQDWLECEQSKVVALESKLAAIHIYQHTAHFLHFAEGILSLYEEVKRQQGVLDYHDQIAYASRLLNHADMSQWVMYKLDEGIDHILLDEAQDTSPEQWEIIQALCNEFFAGYGQSEVQRTLFVVGDEKQSIYSFQGADVAKFGEMQRYFAALSEQSNQPMQQVSLATSYRSSPEVLALVDRVCADEAVTSAITHAEAGVHHAAHRREVAGRVQCWPLVKIEEQEPEAFVLPEERTPPLLPQDALVARVVDEVASWLKQGRYVPGRERAIIPDDVLILVRKRGMLMDKLVRALKRKAVPVAGVDQLKLLEDIAVMDVLALAQFLLLPEDDLTLATVLKTPLVGLDEEALFTLCYGRGEKSVWQRLHEEARNDQAIASALSYLQDLLSQVDYVGPHAMLNRILNLREGRECLLRRLGNEANDSLDELLGLAQQYEQRYDLSLQGFLHWLEQGDVVVKRNLEHAKGCVRVMTVHGAKGLQAPVVILPDTVEYNISKKPVFYCGDAGEIFYAPNTDYLVPEVRALDDVHRKRQEEEYQRLLYVALTRAEDELYITGAEGKKTPYKYSWYFVVKRAMEAIGKEVADGWELMIEAYDERYEKGELQAADVSMPAPWFHAPAKEEVAVRRIPASDLADDAPVMSLVSQQSVAAQQRGVAVHKILEVLPQIKPEAYDEMIAYYLQMYMPEHEAEHTAIADEIHRLLSHEAMAHLLHHPKAESEVPVIGMVDGALVSGRIDRLLVEDDRVRIIDYKTSIDIPTSSAEVPEAYRKQMQAYVALLASIYPDKEVVASLVYTARPVLIDL